MTMAAGAAGVAGALPGAPARWRALGDRLGRLSVADRATVSAAPALWLHAASVGELTAARPLLAQLRQRFPDRVAIVSTLTRTGLALARELPEAHLAFLFPLDAPRVARALLAQVRLDAFFFTETEIWPVFLSALGAAGVPTFMVSGRVSERTVARARLLGRLYRDALAHVVCCMQTEDDARRVRALGADALRVHVTGSLKFDAAPSEPPPEVERLRSALDAHGRRALVAGSTHEGEEEIVLDAYDTVVRAHPDVVLVLAPRHPERADGVEALATGRGLPVVRLGALATTPLPDGPAVVLLDVVGRLPHCYALGAVAFVGGSLVPRGGHNVLEPARAGRPILVGPHTENARDVVERLVAGRGAVRVDSAEALARAVDHFLANPEEATLTGRRARALLQSGHGAVERHMKIIAARLASATFEREGGA